MYVSNKNVVFQRIRSLIKMTFWVKHRPSVCVIIYASINIRLTVDTPHCSGHSPWYRFCWSSAQLLAHIHSAAPQSRPLVEPRRLASSAAGIWCFMKGSTNSIFRRGVTRKQHQEAAWVSLSLIMTWHVPLQHGHTSIYPNVFLQETIGSLRYRIFSNLIRTLFTVSGG